MGFTLTSSAQLGSLGAPVVNETFGAGTSAGTGPALPTGVTNLNYTTNNCSVNDGQYTIVTSLAASCKTTWHNITTDHTGDPNGYFMLVNASFAPSVFYTKRVAGNTLCPSKTYLFNAWVMNILRAIPQTVGNNVQPNITFSVEALDGTPLGTAYETGTIPSTVNPTWIPYNLTFRSPPDGSDVIIKMTNNAPGGNGNDLALDDITFSPFGPVIKSSFTDLSNTNQTVNKCAGDPVNYTLVASQNGYANPTFQWQLNNNDGTGWKDIPGQTTTTLIVDMPKASAAQYQYRIGVLDGTKTSPNCIIYSDPLTINVYAYPANTLAKITSTCIGSPLQLSATGGDSYDWAAPNGTHYSGANPTIANAATASDGGTYYLTITTNGCPTFTTTNVIVYQPATLSPILQPAPICEGSSIVLTTNAQNVTHYKWTPATGLNHDDIANPVASPTETTLYTLVGYNDGCPSVTPSATVTVTVLKKPVANAGETIKLFEGQTAKLNGTAKGGNVYSYWTPSFFLNDNLSLTPTTSATQNITYTLHVVSNNNCGESTSDVLVRVYKKLIIPNAFSPNNDNINDFWNITNIATYPNATVIVYNRNGQQVFQSNGYGKPWAGTYGTSALPAGTYYYVIDLKEDQLPPISGWVFIAR